MEKPKWLLITANKLQTRIIFFFTAFLLIVSTTVTVLSVRKSLEVASAIFAVEGVHLAKKAAALIDGDKFEALSKSLDDGDPFYEETRQELLKIWKETSVYFIYTMAPNRGTVYRFIIDGSGEKGSGTFSPLGKDEETGSF